MRKRRVRPQPRDHRFLQELALVTLMDTQTIHRRYFSEDKTGKACLRRLRYLRDEDLIRSVEITAAFGRSNSMRTMHRLAPKGAQYLAALGLDSPRLLRTDPKADTLLHRLAVARTILSVNDACRQQGWEMPDWILEQDTVPGVPQDTGNLSLAQRFVLVEEFEFPGGEVVRCRPDAASLLRIPTQGNGKWIELIAYWEIDRSTERHAQFLSQKLPGYFALDRSRRYLQHWPQLTGSSPELRVFFTFRSEERLLNLAQKIAEEPTVTFRFPQNVKPTGEQTRQASAFVERVFRMAVASDVENPDRVVTEKVWGSPFKPHPGERRAIYRTPMGDR